MITNKIKYQLLIITLIIIASCARVTSPMGGPEDEDPPELIRSSPTDGQTNFEGTIISLEFNEFIKANQIESNLIITPKPKSSFKTRVNKNTIRLEFAEPFNDSTTYTFSFANTIQDVTANNSARNLSLSFSTGDYLDSLTISGNIVNLYDQNPEEEILVSLYIANDSLDILSGPAQYYAKTDTSGNYRFKNLPSNQYRIYAVKDENNNNKADSDGEFYGYYTDTLAVENSIDNIDFTIQRLSTKDLRLIKGRHFGRYYELNFNKSITDFKTVSLGNYNYSFKDDKTVRFYRTNELYNDTTELIFEATDSLQAILLDTASYYFIESDIESDKFTAELTPSTTVLRPKEQFKLKFNKPIIQIIEDSISVYRDSLTTHPFTLRDSVSNFNQTEYKWSLETKSYLKKSDESITFDFKKGTFISIEGDTATSISKTYKAANEEESAVITGRVNTNYPKVIVQLLKSSNLEIVEQVYAKDYNFNYLPSGSYKIRVIADINENGKWDIGNILKNEAPEPATFYYDESFNTGLIEVRQNWEVEANINFIRE